MLVKADFLYTGNNLKSLECFQDVIKAEPPCAAMLVYERTQESAILSNGYANCKWNKKKQRGNSHWMNTQHL